MTRNDQEQQVVAAILDAAQAQGLVYRLWDGEEYATSYGHDRQQTLDHTAELDEAVLCFRDPARKREPQRQGSITLVFGNGPEDVIQDHTDNAAMRAVVIAAVNATSVHRFQAAWDAQPDVPPPPDRRWSPMSERFTISRDNHADLPAGARTLFMIATLGIWFCAAYLGYLGFALTEATSKGIAVASGAVLALVAILLDRLVKIVFED